MKNPLKNIFLLSVLFFSSHIYCLELVIGEERLEPGIVFIFEGAIKDTILPQHHHLEEKNTHVHIEARANWDSENIPDGTPAEGFVPYLNISAKITNESSGLSTFIDLLPHINLIDNFHYARNIALPGKTNDRYKVEFKISPPSLNELALHNDWVKIYGKKLSKSVHYKYKEVNFFNIANATRN